MQKSSNIEAVLWSIAIPGFGQLLNTKYFKGILLISLEFLINIKSHLNLAIISSFHGETLTAINQIDYQWLMFYPCVYMFAIWDAYKDAEKTLEPFFFLPFVMAAYLGTIGVIYSKTLRIMGVLLGPLWLPLIFMFIGILLGAIMYKFLRIS